MNTFYNISGLEFISFEETVGTRGVIVDATVMKLDQKSRKGTVYRMRDAQRIINTISGKPIFYGVKVTERRAGLISGKHDTSKSPVGIVQRAWRQGNSILARLKITAENLIEKIVSGIQMLFSVQGEADSMTFIPQGENRGFIMNNPSIKSLQIIDSNVETGFADAKVERIVGFEETCEFIVDNELSEDEMLLLNQNLSLAF